MESFHLRRTFFSHLFGIRFLFLMAVSWEHRDSIDFAKGICLSFLLFHLKKEFLRREFIIVSRGGSGGGGC